MVTGWRRAFCTSIPKHRDTKVLIEKQQHQQQHCNNSQQSPKISSKFGFFSNPSTPRLHFQSQSQTVVSSSPRLRCRTTANPTATNTPTSSLPNSPKLQCNTTSNTTTPLKISSYSPRLFLHFQRSKPSSPKSPSSFSLLKSTLRLSKSRCGICLQSVKSGTAIFTAECSHSFHFACVAAHVKKNNSLLFCPVCNATWKDLPLISAPNNNTKLQNNQPQQRQQEVPLSSSPKKVGHVKTKPLRIYNDDEPLSSPTSGTTRFNPIPEENDDENETVEFQGFFVNASSKPPSTLGQTDRNVKNVEVSLLPESAVVAVGRSYEMRAVVLKLKAPQFIESYKTALSVQRRAPIDLVTVVDVSAGPSHAKIQMMKRAMRLVVSSLRDTDRLSIVAFSSTSKRLLPLRRMTSAGRRSARRIVDLLSGVGQGMCVNDAVKKAAKVLQDRRERNAVASIILLSSDAPAQSDGAQKRCSSSPVVSSSPFPHLDIPVHTVGLRDGREDSLAKCVVGLLSVVVQDFTLQLGVVSGSDLTEIAAVYSLTGRPAALGPGSIRLGDLYAGEERELLVELKVPASTATSGAHNVMCVRSTHRDPSNNELLYSKERVLLLPRSQTVRSASTSNPNIERLKNLHVAARAVAESRRFVERNGDLSGAYHLLSSARSLLLQSTSASADEFLRGLDGEMAELQRRRQLQAEVEAKQSSKRGGPGNGNGHVQEKQEPLTPTSAWRAAEMLAKVATMRKSLNRVSDLHGFENARF